MKKERICLYPGILLQGGSSDGNLLSNASPPEWQRTVLTPGTLIIDIWLHSNSIPPAFLLFAWCIVWPQTSCSLPDPPTHPIDIESQTKMETLSLI